MRAALVIPGGPLWPDRTKMSRAGIDRLYYDARTVDSAFLDELRKQRIQIGVQADPGWPEAPNTPEQFAAWVSQTLTTLGSTNKQCAVLLDMEMHDPAWIVACLARWRTLRPTRETQWTLEPGQGGWIKDTPLVPLVNGDPNLRVVCQYYLGEPRMYPFDPGEAVKDLEDAGLERRKLLGFYDAEQRLPAWWNGVTYNLEALP